MTSLHPPGWNTTTHYMSLGGQCGQSCPCCRAEIEETEFGVCPICRPIYNRKRELNPILFWKSNHDYGFLSNWFYSKFTVNEVTFSCVEQYIMYMKAILFNDYSIAEQILITNEPARHKFLGRRVKNFQEDIWVSNRYNILLEGCKAKFEQNLDLKEKLILTRPKILAEASPYDTIYGIGLRSNDSRSKDKQQWNGLNLLGNALMDIRKDLF